jgi:glycosyltransferase involved in cell wall biosynthesis
MKIVHISTSISGGGAAIAAFRLHQNLMKHADIESDMLQRFYIEDKEFAQDNNIYTANTSRSIITRVRKKYNLHTEHFNWVELNKHPKNYDIATFPTTSYRLEDIPMVKDADIIHLHWVAEFLNYPTFFRNVKQPIVWTLHDINPFMGMFHFECDERANEEPFGKLNEEIRKRKIKSINKKDNIYIVCLSEWMKKKSQSSLAFKRYPHLLIPNGLDLTKYPSVDRTQAKIEAGVNNGLKTLLIIGANLNSNAKGFPIALEAINGINKDINLVTVGSGGEAIKTNDNIHHIHFSHINDISKLNSIYTAADLTVLPSREDNLPNIMLESMINGTPLVSFTNGGMAEHINTGVNGILTNEISSKALGKNINDFLDNKYTFDSEKIRQYAIDHFSEQSQTEKYISLYKEILNK